jgi:hypothetical protein
MDLLDAVPTTLPGVLALIDYVAAFNCGEFKFEDMASSACEWPGDILVDEETYSEYDDPGELSFAFAVLLNVRDTLAGLAVRS